VGNAYQREREIAMWKKFKALPPALKIVLVCLFGMFVVAIAISKPKPSPGPGPNMDDETKKQMLEKYKAEDAQLMAQYQQCQAQLNQDARQQTQSTEPGEALPACQQNQQRLLAQALEAEVEIYRLNTGDYHSTVKEIIARMTGQAGGGGGSYAPSGSGGGSAQSDDDFVPATGGYDPPGGGYAQSGGGYVPSGGGYVPANNSAASDYISGMQANSDAALRSVDQYDRNVIQENSNFTDQYGDQHSLPNSPYYYQNTTTGEYVPTETQTVPDNHSDYVPLTSDDH
jgi:hypothetical protein